MGGWALGLSRARNGRTGTSVHGPTAHWPYNWLKAGATLEMDMSDLDSDRTLRIWVGRLCPA
jgi:hypothetical protein